LDTQSSVTDKLVVTDEVVDISSLRNTTGGINSSELRALNLAAKPDKDDWQYPTGDLSCSVGSFVLKNGSGDTMTLNTDYVIDTNYYNFTLNMSTDANFGVDGSDNNTYVSYTYCDDGYNTNSSSRGIARLWSLFAALIIVTATLFGIRHWLQ